MEEWPRNFMLNNWRYERFSAYFLTSNRNYLYSLVLGIMRVESLVLELEAE
jgi:hypothetical protein